MLYGRLILFLVVRLICSLVFKNTSSKRGVDVYSSLYRDLICATSSVLVIL